MWLLTVRICRVVVENAAGGPVETAHNHKMTLVLRSPAETLLTHRQEAAVFDRRGAEFTRQDDGVDQHYGNMALLQVRLNFLNRHRTTDRLSQIHVSVRFVLSRAKTCPKEWTKNSPFLHHHAFGLCFKEELIHSGFFSIKMLLIKGLQTTVETIQTHQKWSWSCSEWQGKSLGTGLITFVWLSRLPDS